MGVFTFGTGKGLREPVSPFRTANVFGADLNDINADNWNAIPVIINPTTVVDLSVLDPGHEVITALLGVQSAAGGDYQVDIDWYRSRDNARLFHFDYSKSVIPGGWLYAYSYLGYLAWEINENGSYDVEVTVSGAEVFRRAIRFNISGIPTGPAPVPVTGGFIQGITSRIAEAADFLYSAWIEVRSWIWPFNLLGESLFGVAQAFDWLVAHFLDFGAWVTMINQRAAEILSSVNIVSLLRTWIDYAESSWGWIQDAWQNVPDIVDVWWSSTSLIVRAWIDIGIDGARSLIGQVSASLADLRTEWDNFWTITWPGLLFDVNLLRSNWTGFQAITLPGLATWSGVSALIESTIRTWFPFYDELTSLWGEIREFFTDPFDWLVGKFEAWFWEDA